MQPKASQDAKERGERTGRWVWNDQASSWRPQLAGYDRDVNAIVTRFDHVCPFTGTAIGQLNIRSFYMFTFAIQVLIYFSLFVLIWSLWTVSSKGYTAPT